MQNNVLSCKISLWVRKETYWATWQGIRIKFIHPPCCFKDPLAAKHVEMLSSEVSDNLVNGFPQLGGNPMVTGPARRYDVTISRLMPIYNGNGARQGAHQSLFVRRQVESRAEKMIVQCPTTSTLTSPLLHNELLNTNAWTQTEQLSRLIETDKYCFP